MNKRLLSDNYNIDGNLQNFKLKVERLNAVAYKGVVHDYLLIVYEYYPQTQIYVRASVIRVRIMSEAGVEKFEEVIKTSSKNLIF